MSTILFIGDYYPFASFKSKFNELAASELKGKGNDIILLSDSWCRMTKKNSALGDLDDLTNAGPFCKRYFLDPIQVSYSGGNRLSCLLALACKVIDSEKIDAVVYAGSPDNVLLIELIKNRYSLPCHMFMYDAEALRKTLDNYTFPYLCGAMGHFEKIYTYAPYADFLQSYFKIKPEKIEAVLPICADNKTVSNYPHGGAYILCEEINNDKYRRIKVLIDSFTPALNFRIAVFNNYIPSLPSDIEIEPLSVSFKLPKGAYILFDDEIFKPDLMNVTDYLLALAHGCIPIVAEANAAKLAEHYALTAKSLDIAGYNAITAINELQKNINKYKSSIA